MFNALNFKYLLSIIIIIMLQSVFIGKAREIYAALAVSQNTLSSVKVKFVLFNDATGTHRFLSYHRLLDVIHMVTLTHFLEGNPLPPHRLLFSISSKGSFICTFP